MQSSLTLDRLKEMKGSPVYSSDDQKVGGIEEIFLDEETRTPEWIGLGGGMFGGKHLVPVEGATFEDNAIHLPYTKEQVNSAENYDGDRVDQETERKLYEHYGLQYSHEPSGTGLPGDATNSARRTDGGASPRDSDATMTRSEEEIRIGKREVDAGTVRLRKYVETEPVTQDVQLRRETVDIQHEPINEPSRGGEIGEQEVEVNLRGEEAVVQKDTVAKENITARKKADTRQETVQEQVRKERIDVDDQAERT